MARRAVRCYLLLEKLICMYLFVNCAVFCFSFLALCSTTESGCLAAMLLLCCLCFQRKEDGWNFILPEHCSHAQFVFINDATLCHRVRSPNQWLLIGCLIVYSYAHLLHEEEKQTNKQKKPCNLLICVHISLEKTESPIAVEPPQLFCLVSSIIFYDKKLAFVYALKSVFNMLYMHQQAADLQ